MRPSPGTKASHLEEPEVKVTRLISAPRELVFAAWSQPEHLERWYAPKGCAVRFKRMDFRVHGTFHSCIANPAFGECWCRGVYLEIVVPERIVMTMQSSDADGQFVDPVDAGHDPDWPRETTVTVTFEEEQGRTKLTLQQTVSESLAKRTGAYPSWLQMLDQLDELLQLQR